MKARRSRRDKVFLAMKLGLLGFITSFWGFTFLDLGVMFDNAQQSLWVHAPTVVVAGEPFNTTVEAWDRYERVAGAYTGKVTFGLESYAAGTNATSLPGATLTITGNGTRFTSNFNGAGIVPAYTVPGADNGRKTYRASIDTAGIHYIVATDQDARETFRSNPIIVVPVAGTVDRVYWGDLHFHSALSDGAGTEDEVYTYARDVALLDFAALTDHAELFPRFGEADMGDTFKNYLATTNRFNAAGQFATVIALRLFALPPAIDSWLGRTM